MTGVLKPYSIVIRQGDSFNILLHFKTETKDLNLENCLLKMSVKDGNDKLVIDKTGEILENHSGKARIKLTAEDTSIKCGDYKTDIQIRMENGDVHTVYPQDVNKTAVLRITPHVTD